MKIKRGFLQKHRDVSQLHGSKITFRIHCFLYLLLFHSFQIHYMILLGRSRIGHISEVELFIDIVNLHGTTVQQLTEKKFA